MADEKPPAAGSTASRPGTAATGPAPASKGVSGITGSAGSQARPAREGRNRQKSNQTEAKFDDFIAAVHRMSTAVAESGVFAKHGVTIGEWSVLKLMSGSSEASLAKVSKRSGISRQRLRTLLGDLEKKGFIKVTRNEGDARTRSVGVLPTTGQIVGAIATDFDEMAALKGVSPKRLSTAVRLASSLAALIIRSNPEGEEGGAHGGKRGKGGKASTDPARIAARAEREKQRAAARGDGNPGA